MNLKKNSVLSEYRWIAYSDTKILILSKTHTGNGLILILLGGITVLAFFFPFIFMVLLSIDLTSGFFVTVTIFWVTGFYFLRLLLWNIKGTEQIEISKNLIKIYHDFRFFKLYHDSIDTVSLSIGYMPYESAILNQSNGEKFKILIFRSSNKTLKSYIPLTVGQAVKIRTEILEYCEKVA